MADYRITGERMAGIADQARRLGRTEAMLNPARIEEVLAGVSTGTESSGNLPENALLCYVGVAQSSMDLTTLSAGNTAYGSVLEDN